MNIAYHSSKHILTGSFEQCQDYIVQSEDDKLRLSPQNGGGGGAALSTKKYVTFVACTEMVPIVVVYRSKLKILKSVNKYGACSGEECLCISGVTVK